MNIKSGTGPNIQSHKDHDLHLSFGNTAPFTFPEEFFTDSTADFPDQNRDGEPFGCTNYTQAELATDLTNGLVVFKPFDLEAVTHANQKGGLDIRESLSAAKNLGWIKGYYVITQIPGLDMTDSLRTAQTACLPENRSISVGMPWFPSWEKDILAGKKVLSMPTDAELAVARKDPRALPWHNSKFGGWPKLNGAVQYRDKSWQGTSIGYVYFPREVINTVMAIWGTVAYTGTNQIPETIETVQLSMLQHFISLLRDLIAQLTHMTTPTPPPQPSKPQSKIHDWALAITAGEGATPASNNPGNLKYSNLTASWGGKKGRKATDGGFFCTFDTYDKGFEALCNFLTLGAQNQLIAFHHSRTLQAFTKVYAGNPPQGYIDAIGKRLGVPLTTDISTFL